MALLPVTLYFIFTLQDFLVLLKLAKEKLASVGRKKKSKEQIPDRHSKSILSWSSFHEWMVKDRIQTRISFSKFQHHSEEVCLQRRDNLEK